MAGLIGGVLALPARAQDCYIPATGDAYLWADGLGDVYGYSITYNTCQDPNVYVQVYAELDDAGWYALDSGTDIEYFGNDAEVDIAATVFYAGNYYQYGVHQYYECGYSGWEPASPEYTEYMAWSPAPNAVPTVTSTYPTDSGGDPTWTPGGGFYNGAYEVAFEGEELTGEIPTVSDSGCTSNSPGVPPYVVAAWETADNEVWTTVTVSSSLVGGCYLYASLLTAEAAAFLQGSAPPPPPALQIRSGPNGGGTTVTGTRTAVVGQFFDLFARVTNWSGGESFQWTLPGDGNVVPESGWTANVNSTAGEPGAVAKNASELFWAFYDTSASGGSVSVNATLAGGPTVPPASLIFTVNGPQTTSINASTPNVVTISSSCPQNSGVQSICPYDPNSGTPGMNFSFNPQTDGAYSILQVLNGMTVTQTGVGNTPNCVATTSGLDSTLRPVSGSSNAFNDSPSVPLPPGTEYSQVAVSESFTAYLMFAPPGGTMVPVANVGWSWSATAVYNGIWSLVPNTSPVTLGSSATTTAYPTWTQPANTGAACNAQ